MERLILYIFSYLAEGYTVYYYASYFFAPRFRTFVRTLTLIFLYLALFFISFLKMPWLNGVAFILINGVFLFSQYDIRFSQGILHLAILAAIMAASESIVYSLVSKYAPHFYKSAKDGLALILFTVFSKILYLLVAYLLTLLAGRQKLQQSPNDHSAPLLILIPVASFFIILTFIIIGEASSSFSSDINILVMISTLFLLLMNLLVFGVNQYNQKKSQEFTDMQILLQKESDLAQYYEMLAVHNESQGILIHDLKKHLQSISLLNKDHETDKIEAYIYQLLQSSDLNETVKLCDNKMLNAILCRYQRQCTGDNLKFHADIRSQSTDFLDNTVLTSLFCNLLDNAVEAARGIPDGYVELTVKKKENTPLVMITVINSCRRNPLALKGELLASSKKDGRRHGFGMKSIRRTVKQYGGDMEVYFDENTHTFHSLITLRDQTIRPC